LTSTSHIEARANERKNINANASAPSISQEILECSVDDARWLVTVRVHLPHQFTITATAATQLRTGVPDPSPIVSCSAADGAGALRPQRVRVLLLPMNDPP